MSEIRNVLIIDDDGDDRDMFCEAIKDILPLANCVKAVNGEKAIQHLRESQDLPQYIFLDVYMNGMDGKECLLKIKSIKNMIRIPVVMYSGMVDDENEKKIYKKLGANHYISKGSSIEALKTSLKDFFKI